MLPAEVSDTEKRSASNGGHGLCILNRPSHA
jgi:hypothetical protein